MKMQTRPGKSYKSHIGKRQTARKENKSIHGFHGSIFPFAVSGLHHWYH